MINKQSGLFGLRKKWRERTLDAKAKEVMTIRTGFRWRLSSRNLLTSDGFSFFGRKLASDVERDN